MNTITKSLIGLTAVGGLAGGSFWASHYFTNENIKSKLEANGYQILGESAEWEEILKVYATSNTLQFDGFNGTTSANTTPKSIDVLKQKCEKALGTSLSEDKENALYKKAEKWCIKPQTVSERLKWLNHEELNTTSTDNDTDWDQKVNEHKIATENRLSELTKEIEGKAKEESRAKIKEVCKVALAKKTYEAEYKNSLTKASAWCSKKIK